MRPGLLAILLVIAALPAPVHAAPDLSAGEVIALINDYRASNGLYALIQNNILMQTAQGQSDYQASISQVTHGGPGGSRPRDRAYAAGYGGGQVVFISELVTGGFDQSPEGALTWWQNSPEHNSYLLSSNYFDLGVGVATDADGRYYYTAVLGNIAGGTTYVPESGTVITPQAVMIPVVKAEPRENGALVHIVRQGQALWTIAAVYEVPLDEIFTLNNLNANSFIFPGDEIIVAPEGTYMPTPTPIPTTSEDDSSPGSSGDLTSTPRSTEEEIAELPGGPNDSGNDVDTAGETASDNDQNGSVNASADAESQNTSVKWVVGLALASILGVIIASFFIQSPRKAEQNSDNDPFAPIS